MMKKALPKTLRYSLYAGLFSILLILCLSVGAAIWGLGRAALYLERANHSYEQLALVSSLEAKINQYLLSEIANTVNFQGRDQLIKASPALITESLGDLQSSIELEDEFIKEQGFETNLTKEINTAISLASVFIRMHLAAKHESKDRANMESAQAVRRFFANVVEGNDKKLSQVVRDISKNEQAAVKLVKSEIINLTGLITNATTILALITIAGVIGLALFLNRSIVGPVQSLALGADKFAAGDLAFRIKPIRKDELGLVANHFNKMAGQLETQQNLLRASNEHLEQAVIERTQELKQSNTRLRQIDETRRRFFSNISHELRTPVTVLLGEAEVALRAASPKIEELKETLSRIVANGGYLRRRLNDLLNLARSDDGEIKLELQENVLNECVEAAISAAASYASANDVTIKFNAPKADFIAAIDESWFRQCMLVLIDNAVKFSKPNDTVTIELTADQKQRHEPTARIEVRDEGPGIEEEALPHLFERYYQAKEGQKREGTGLGLAIAEWIIDGHGGRIWAENNKPTGTSIKIELELIE